MKRRTTFIVTVYISFAFLLLVLRVTKIRVNETVVWTDGKSALTACVEGRLGVGVGVALQTPLGLKPFWVEQLMVLVADAVRLWLLRLVQGEV